MIRVGTPTPQEEPVDDAALMEQEEAVSDPALMEEEMVEAPQSTGTVDQSIVVYMTSDYGPFQCANCEHFVGPNACSVVKGEIDPNGICNIFTPTSQEEVDPMMEEDLAPSDSQPELEEVPENEPSELV